MKDSFIGARESSLSGSASVRMASKSSYSNEQLTVLAVIAVDQSRL